jgi:tryptophan-rich sensory protein
MVARSKGSQLGGLAGWLGIVFVPAAAGAVASLDAAGFYMQLARPSWAPSPAVFGPVWTLLYLMMAVAAWLVWRTPAAPARGRALALFVVQLALNALWSWLFFAWHRGALALADIAVLWVLIVATIVAFRRVVPLAAGLLVPYLRWVSFACALNYAVWQLNPQLLGQARVSAPVAQRA